MLQLLLLVELNALGGATAEMLMIFEDCAYAILQFDRVLCILKCMTYWLQHLLACLTLEFLHAVEIETIAYVGKKQDDDEQEPPRLIEIRTHYHLYACHITLVVGQGR